jgi:hypothetical protein
LSSDRQQFRAELLAEYSRTAITFNSGCSPRNNHRYDAAIGYVQRANLKVRTTDRRLVA